MNRTKFSMIAHQDHCFANPLSEAKVDRLLDLLALTPGSRVLDVGCGNAELLIRLIERYQISSIFGAGATAICSGAATHWALHCICFRYKPREK